MTAVGAQRLAGFVALGFMTAIGAACSSSGAGMPLGPSPTGGPDGEKSDAEASPDAATIADDAGPTESRDAGSCASAPRFTWWRDVQPIVANKCQLCHGDPPLYGAPRSLVTYADTQAIAQGGDPVYRLMAFKIVARMEAMPPPGQPQLTAEEKSAIIGWADDCAPEGTPPPPPSDAGTGSRDGAPPRADGGAAPDSGPGSSDGGTTMGASVTLEFFAHDPGSMSPYAVGTGNTQYICWAFSVPASITGRQHAVRFEPVVVNTAHLHHMLLFRNSRADAQAGPVDCTSWPYNYEMVAGWAPGRQAVDMPPGVGVPVNAGDQFVLQAHYNAVTSPATDASGMRMVVVDTPNLIDAGILWSGVIFGTAISGPNVSKTGVCSIGSPITVFSDFPHMHRTGTHITLDVQRAGSGTWTNLVDVSPWSFDDQPNSPIPQAEQMINRNDQLRTTCWWDTMGRSISYGEASNDEMCFNFIYHYPLMSNQYACVTPTF
jgi:cytochrome c5